MKNKRNGFTLIEVMVTAAILGVAAISIVQVMNSIKKKERATMQKQAAAELKMEVLGYMKSKVACLNTVGSGTAVSSASSSCWPGSCPTPAAIYKVDPTGVTPVSVLDITTNKDYRANQAGMLRLTKLGLIDYHGEAAVAGKTVKGELTLRIQALRGDRLAAATPSYAAGDYIDIDVPIGVLVSGTGAIVGCNTQDITYKKASCDALGGSFVYDANGVGTCKMKFCTQGVAGCTTQNVTCPAGQRATGFGTGGQVICN